jgi:hypothetical protein
MFLSTFFVLKTWVLQKSIVNYTQFTVKNVMSNMGGWTDVHDEEWSCRPSVVAMFLLKVLTKSLWKTALYNFRILCEFPQISHTLLYEIITVRLDYHKFCTRWVPKMLTDAHKSQRVALALTFLQWDHKAGDEFLSYIIWVAVDETWVSFVNVETKEQSKQWMHTHLPNKPKKFK